MNNFERDYAWSSRKEPKSVMGVPRSTRRRFEDVESSSSSEDEDKPQPTEDLKLKEPTVCVYFPELPDHNNLTPEEFQFHLYACGHKHRNQLHRYNLPAKPVQCRYCGEKFFKQVSSYHRQRCEKRKAAKKEARARKDQPLVKLVESVAEMEVSKSANAPNPVAEDEDWDAADVVPRNMTGGPICAFNPFKKVDKSAVIVIPIGKTKSERRHLIKKRAELFTMKQEVKKDGDSDW